MENEDQSVASCESLSEETKRGGLFTALKNTDLSIREGIQRVSQSVTTSALHRWKHDSITQTTPFLGGYSKRCQSEQETGNVGTC